MPFGVTAGVVAAYLAWSWLHQPNEAVQLIEILAGKSVPDAAWAFQRLDDLGVEDLPDLVPYLTDARTTPLKAVYHGKGMEWDPRGLSLLRLVKGVLVSRIPDKLVPIDDGPIDSPQRWDRHRWELEIQQLLDERSREQPTGRRRFWKIGPVRPPTSSGDFVRKSPDDAARISNIIALLGGDDAALVVWLVEVLRRAPDEALDGLLAHASNPTPTKVRLFCSEHDPVSRADGFTIGHLVRMLLAERIEDDVLYYNVRRYEVPGLAVQVKVAWQGHRDSPGVQ